LKELIKGVHDRWKNVDDNHTPGEAVGMNKELVEGVLNSDAYGQEVKVILPWLSK
jgi:hypothetical protein